MQMHLESEEGRRLLRTNLWKNHDKMNNLILQCEIFLKRIYNVVLRNIHVLNCNFEIIITIIFLKSLQCFTLLNIPEEEGF